VLYLLPGPIQAFKQRHPEVPIIVRNQSVEETVAMLRRGDLDVGLRSVASPPADLDYRPWRAFDRVVIAPPGHPIGRAGRITLRLLATFPPRHAGKGSMTRRLVERR
jgi:DNA-binding transcriptional LysR family regulator